jgi:hypothetical protein
MSFAQVLEELPALTTEQRQVLMRRALELEDSPLSGADEALVESRLAAHKKDPASSVPLAEIKRRLRSQK